MPNIFSDLRFRLRAIFQRSAVERELDDELRFHLEQEIEKNVRGGMRRDEATRQARLAFGGLDRIKDDTRDARGVSALEVLTQDLRYAVRGIRAQPAFAVGVIATLGLGIGANAAMFGVVDRLMFRPPAYLHDPATVNRVLLASIYRGKQQQDYFFEFTRYLDLKRWTTTFADIAPFTSTMHAVGAGDQAREMRVGAVSANYFGFFDARPVIGRFFAATEDSLPVGAYVVVLGYDYWQTRFGGRADALGQPLQVGSLICTIIGVAPRGFLGASTDEPPQLFIPITTYAGTRPGDMGKTYYTNYNWVWMQVIVRRKPGVSVAVADADLTSAYRRSYEAEGAMSKIAPLDMARPHAVAAPIQLGRGPKVDRDSKVVKWIAGVSILVLLIACANVANLLLARALRRRREIAVRLALGVSRGRLLAQLLTESLVLAGIGGAVGLVIAQWSARMLGTLFLPAGTELGAFGDGRTLVFAAAAAILCAILTSIAPALRAGRTDLAVALKSGAREGSYQRSRLRTSLLIAQGALSVVLLVGAGLFVRSLQNVRAMPLGYDVAPVLSVRLNMRGVKLSTEEQILLARRMEEEARTIPGVVNASRGLTLPFRDLWAHPLHVPGIDSVARLGHFSLQGGAPTLFATVGTRIVRGRGIQEEDRKEAPGVMIVSEAMAKVLWPERDAIGQCVKVGADTAPCNTVVGIAEDIKETSLTDDQGLHYYLSIEQFHPEDASLFVRTRGDAAPQAETIRRRLQTLMPGNSYITVTPMSRIFASESRAWRFGATMFVAFGALAIVLAAIGLYSVVAYTVAQRTQEIGVRIALGAQSGDVLRLIVGEGLRFAVIGVTIGTLLALGAGRWIEPLLFDVSPKDPAVFGGVAVLLVLVAVAAAAIPASRASRVDPNIALRAE